MGVGRNVSRGTMVDFSRDDLLPPLQKIFCKKNKKSFAGVATVVKFCFNNCETEKKIY